MKYLLTVISAQTIILKDLNSMKKFNESKHGSLMFTKKQTIVFFLF